MKYGKKDNYPEYIKDKFTVKEIINMIENKHPLIKAIYADSYNSYVSIYFSDNTYSDIGYSTYFEALSKSKGIMFYES